MIDRKAQIEKLMKDFHEVAVSYIKKEMITPFGDLSGFTCTLKMDWTSTRRSSRGGMYAKGPGVNYAMSHPSIMMRDGHYWEYKSYERDRTIGQFTTKDVEFAVYALQCHEMAHAIVGYLKLNPRAHGKEWKSIYAQLRNHFINPYVKGCVVDKEKFVIKGAKPVSSDDEFMLFVNKMGAEGYNGRDYWGKTFSHKGTDYKVIGWNKRGRKYKVRAVNARGTEYRFPVTTIVNGVK